MARGLGGGADVAVGVSWAVGPTGRARWRRGQTPLHFAAEFGRGAVAEQLVAAGAAEDAVDKRGPAPSEVAPPLGFAAVERFQPLKNSVEMRCISVKIVGYMFLIRV